jgi:peptidoglycan-associated lipoprotein
MKLGRLVKPACCVFLISIAFAGCKKKVAATPPATTVQAAAPAQSPVPTITLRVNPGAVDRGQSVGLQWEARNASSVRIEPELGSVQLQGSRQVNPSSSVTYVATATGPGGSASDSARVTVRVPAPPAAPASVTPPAARPNVSLSDLFAQNVQPILFDYDKSDIRSDQISRLNADAAWLKEHRDAKFTIEGYCDDRGTEEYNLGLGDRRANGVKEYLIQQGIDTSRIKVVSYGEERPICHEETEECYQRNRRAAFVLQPLS